MKLLKTEIQINASPEKVWSVLTGLDEYSSWNPFIKEAKGKVKQGEQLKVLIAPPGKNAMTFKPIVKSVVKYREFSWLGRFLLPGIFDGEHIFTITENNKGCLLVQKEKFSGLLVPLMWHSLEKNTRRGFELMNSALKQRVEGISI